MNIYTYTDEDIMRVLQKSLDMIEQDKDRAIHIYEIMLQKMATDDGNLVVLSQMADRYLEQASRATDNILRLANVMQKLRAARDNKKNGGESDFKKILAELDLAGASPFMAKNEKGELSVGGAAPDGEKITETNLSSEKTEKVDTKPEGNKNNDEDIQLEADL